MGRNTITTEVQNTLCEAGTEILHPRRGQKYYTQGVQGVDCCIGIPSATAQGSGCGIGISYATAQGALYFLWKNTLGIFGGNDFQKSALVIFGSGLAGLRNCRAQDLQGLDLAGLRSCRAQVLQGPGPE